MLLYINDERCDSVEQLQSYFTRLGEGCIYDDLLDCGRHGDISEWLREMNNVEYADGLDAIDKSLGDNDFVNAMSEVLTGNDLNELLVKKPYNECFSIERASIDEENDKFVVLLYVKVCSGVNENYEIMISSNCGTKGDLFNPSEYEENRIYTRKYEFYKRPGRKFGDLRFVVEGEEVEVKRDDIESENLSVEEKKADVEGMQVKSVRTQNNIKFTISLDFTMIKVEGGTFKMGAQANEENSANYNKEANENESPVHSVSLSDYYIGETLVTQELWTAVMGENPSNFKGSQRPVEQVSWNDCKEFIKKLNQLTDKNFRLPTEAEWEYAARGGNKSQGNEYSGGNDIDKVAWHSSNSNIQTHDVKTKSPNELGIYDMSGNVWEWCEDLYGDYYSGELQTNPTGPSKGSHRVRRGGSWGSSARGCRVSYRSNYDPDSRLHDFGFRLVL